jgi:PII-like signaling protein
MTDLATVIRLERRAQGLPEVIEDVATLARITRIVDTVDERTSDKAAA